MPGAYGRLAHARRAILSEVVATLSLRPSEGFSRAGPTPLMAVGYLVSFVLLAQALKRGMGIGVAYAVWAGVGVALVAILGRVLFNEPLSPVTAAGIALTIGGVVIVESSTATR
jgi:small multidrug resistance pump